MCPVQIQKTVLCRNCDRAVESDKMYEISYRTIIGIDCRMPKILKKIHRSMSETEYLTCRASLLFLNKETLVCNDCYLWFVRRDERRLIRTSTEVRLLNPQLTKARRDETLAKKTDQRSEVRTRESMTSFREEDQCVSDIRSLLRRAGMPGRRSEMNIEALLKDSWGRNRRPQY